MPNSIYKLFPDASQLQELAEINEWEEETMITDRELAFNLSRLSNENATNFTVMLFRLIAKADPQNIRLIAMGFPRHVQIYLEWQKTTFENDFFKKYGVQK